MHRQIIFALCVCLGRCNDDAVLLQAPDVPQKNEQLRNMLKQVPGAPDLPAGMPEIKMDEVMNLLPLIPDAIKAIKDELPNVEVTAGALQDTTKAKVEEMLKAVKSDTTEEELHKLFSAMVQGYKGVWVDFAKSLVVGLEKALGPIIDRADKLVSFIPPNATGLLINLINDQLQRTAMSALAQLPVNDPGADGISRVNRHAHRYWNLTHTTIKNFAGVIGADQEEGGPLDALSMLPLGVNITQVIADLKPRALFCLNAVDFANSNITNGLHDATKAAGMHWREQKKSGSVGIRVGATFFVALAFSIFHF